MTARAILVLLASLMLCSAATAEPNRVRSPDQSMVDALVHYTTARRGNMTEFMYTTPAALEAIKAGEPLPVGTQVLLQDWRDGEVYRLFVMEKGDGWGTDYDAATRTDDWQFQWY